MSRALFISQLRQGLRGLEPDEIDDICADYESHFADAGETGRSETEIAAALGNPAQLAREWRAESGLRELAKQAVRLEDLTFYDKNNETLTVACTCLESGNAIWPTIPGDGKLTIDVRYSSEQLANTYDAFFKNLTSFNPKVRVETKGGINKPPFDKENIGNKALYKRAIEVAARLGIELKGEVVMGGSDGNFTSAVGCPTLDGLGMTGDFVHNPKEYINLDCVPPRGAMVAELALRTLEG